MGKRRVNLHIHDVWVHDKRVDELTVEVPIPAGLSKRERRAYSDGAADAASHILNAVQPRIRPQKTVFEIPTKVNGTGYAIAG